MKVREVHGVVRSTQRHTEKLNRFSNTINQEMLKMKIKDVIKQLQAVENKELELYVCDEEGNNISIKDITLFDSEAEHTENNPLGINY